MALLRADTLYQSIGVTATDLGVQLQAERARSAVAISSRVVTSDLGAQRAATDEAMRKFRDAEGAGRAEDRIGAELRAPIDTLQSQLDKLPTIRAGIDSGRSDRLTALTDYNGVLDRVYRLYDQLVAVPDMSIYQQAGAMQAMGNAREIIARENALISGVLIDQRISPQEHNAFTEYVSTRRFLHARGLSALDAELREPYEKLLTSPVFSRFTGLEDRIVETSGDGSLPAEADRWRTTVDSVSASLDELGTSSSNVLSERSGSVATGIMVRIAAAGGLGLLAVIASIIISIRFGRRLARELAGLRKAATELAGVRLPRIVERLRRGEEVDVETEAPPIHATGATEIKDVAEAFGSVQRTAVEAAVGQANLRRGVGQVFLNLARRKQALLHRQLALLDGMQRRTEDPDTLDDLFRLDHLTTRMRRHAEGLIILSGATPGRAWRKPVPVIDILRAAVAEVEDYTRVTVQPVPNTALDGAAVADVTHLVAELVENATVFSPPETTVLVRGDLVANGFAIEVEDRGSGLQPEEYEAINERLAGPPEFDLADSDRLGLFVVGQLAARHGIHVVLRASPYGGTVAIVLVPRTVVAESQVPGVVVPTPRRTLPGSRRHARKAGREPGQDAPRQPLTEGAHRTPEPATAETAGTPGDVVSAQAPPAADERGPFTPSEDRPALPSRRARRGLAQPAAERPWERERPEESPAESTKESTAVPVAGTARNTPSGAVPGAAPEPEPATEAELAEPGTTEAGLPRRVRQANLAPQLRQNPANDDQSRRKADPATPEDPPDPADRSPEEARSMFSAFQRGTQRAREDAEYVHQTTGDKRNE
ncbi:nitrate- and nitrite sensing domain-containing protein [Spongiactinospora sp. TRM90649]|uniref:sensor histidine kinase n=1 Tax=Spongiactinospora sp. TRM90649 TaxID=3031114 RepID=UPI0023F6EC74|nr:nitrate- and nitrite sensing domain-containing protein [Spongiactinospora sp. TRM90649]MDF5758995.1 nitrate- and nitrite sensing domain-containing protein [Spongiactinospora sp. TRM90649]